MSADLKEYLLGLLEGKIVSQRKMVEVSSTNVCQDFEGQKRVEDITKFTLIAASVSGSFDRGRAPISY